MFGGCMQVHLDWIRKMIRYTEDKYLISIRHRRGAKKAIGPVLQFWIEPCFRRQVLELTKEIIEEEAEEDTEVEHADATPEGGAVCIDRL